jgi:threonylcarbamoyladenosine tRNA methylthiotransferase MtaB
MHPRVVTVPNEQKKNIPELFGAYPVQYISSFSEHSRAFIKVADGCPHRCSYCIVSKLRGVLHSRPIDDILKEAEILSKNGYKEIVLTAINLASYGRDIGSSLVTLLKAIDSSGLFPRIRLSSLEPHFIDERLLEGLSECVHICPHFHIPLQAGSDEILKAMNRPYIVQDFLAITEKLKKIFDRPALSTDIIIGFPGETEADFLCTLRIAEEVGFCRIHIFPFSAREGTEAWNLPNGVSHKVIRKRAELLKNLANRLAEIYRRSLIGIQETVVVEEVHKDGVIGLIERYQKVKIEGSVAKRGECLSAQIYDVHPSSQILLANLQ